MHLAAMLDIGIDRAFLLGELQKLGLDGYTIDISRDQRKGIAGTRVKVRVSDDKKHHVSRNLGDIEAIISGSGLTDAVKKKSLNIFHRLAAAEAKVHGKTVQEIHFHETGAVDAIVDIAAAAICVDSLKVDRILCSPVELGSGFVECEHGTLPVPAPATIELLQNVPVRTGRVAFETTTPTGAAILAEFVDEFGSGFEFTPEKTGYGIGARDLPVANVLRVCVGSQAANLYSSGRAMVLECNLDDMNPEFYDYLIDKLLTNGAMDAFITPVIMKKTRPAAKLSVLCSTNERANLTRLLLSETTTLGIRKYDVERTMLDRELSVISTKYGDVRIKTALMNQKPVKWKPEYEDCVKLAKEHDVPIQTVYDEVNGVLFGQKR